MALHPMFSALRRNKAGAVLIALQMAVTLAILCNAVYIIHQRVANAARPVVMAVIGNLWIVKSFAMERLPYLYIAAGVAAMFVLGQLSVLWPALRAASVPPAVATRTV